MSDRDATLGPRQRAEAIRKLSEKQFDVLVIGAGVVGAGAALDAATRGLSVALVEAQDYASGTSSRSSKLIHGGLRYLEHLEFGLVREALRERALILNLLCPHLARPVPFLYPLTRRGWERAYVGSGIALYDVLGGRHGVPSHRHLSKKRARSTFPSLRSDALVGAIRYYDGQIDDARHTMMLSRTAHQHGAVCASSVKVTGFSREGDRVTGAHAIDVETGEQILIRARHTINAAGVWTDEMQTLAGVQGQLRVRASKGVHLVVPKGRINASAGLISRTPTSVLFIIPWGNHWLIGTTDTEWKLDLAHPAANRKDIDYILDQANRLLADPLTHEDIEGVFAGLRPLLDGADRESRLSREHAVVSPVPGLTLVTGGKYTTYRVMAKGAVDSALGSRRPMPSSITHQVPLVGARDFAATWNARETLAASVNLHVARIEQMLRRYGTLIHDLLQIIEDDAELGQPLIGAPDYLGAEIHYGASHEGALHLDDLLSRRTRISIETFDRGAKAAREAARIAGKVLGWSERTMQREVEQYLARVEAELESQREPDDESANTRRRRAPSSRPKGALA